MQLLNNVPFLYRVTYIMHILLSCQSYALRLQSTTKVGSLLPKYKAVHAKLPTSSYSYQLLSTAVNSVQDSLNTSQTIKSKLRTESIYDYDTQLFNFKEVIRDVLGIQPISIDGHFESLHNSWSAGQDGPGAVVVDKAGNSVSRLQIVWNMDRGRLSNTCIQQYKPFDELYRNFIKKVIAPRLGGGRILYQRAPTLRISFPSNSTTSVIHNDEDYHHQPSEINFWLPLTTVGGNNSLWLESQPGRGDWHALEMQYGSICQFYGNQCRHFAVPNDTNTTRLSIDFRVVSDASGGHDANFHKGIPRGSKAKFKKVYDIPDYYSVIETPTKMIV